jgi:ABC-type bacteriocin/lantibiotic exporter with double-glycine peptidase domain
MTKLNVKPFQETLHADMCGPASLKIILEYYGISKSEKELADLCNLVPGLGVDDKSIKSAAEKLGFKVEIKNESSFEDIEEWLKKGMPVIVDWFTRGRQDYNDSEVPDGHYSVVTGLDDEYIYLQDPEIGAERKIKREDFMKVWFDFLGYHLKPDELILRQIIAIYK